MASFVVLLDPPEPTRGEDGVWYYGKTEVPVPGAEDITVADETDFMVVTDKAGQRQAVLIARSAVETDQALKWVEGAGQLLRADHDEDVYRVVWSSWQERSSAPVGLRAPEREGTGLRRLMAVEERDVRLLRKALERQSERRARLVLLATRFGMTRRVIGEMVGLSPGRVQQMVDDAPAGVALEVAQMVRDTLEVLRMIGPRSVRHDVVELPEGRDAAFLAELVEMDFLERDGDEPDLLRVSDEGARVEMHLRSQPEKGRGRRGR